MPDFRSADGLSSKRTGLNEARSYADLFDEVIVRKHPPALTALHRLLCVLSQHCETARPTDFHWTLNGLAEEGRLLRLYTQNIDNLDADMRALGTAPPLRKDVESGTWPPTVQLHGSLRHAVCTKCHIIQPFDRTAFAQSDRPVCNRCTDPQKRAARVGRLQPRVTLYNQKPEYDEEAINDVFKEDIAAGPDVLIVVGTSLHVGGARLLAEQFAKKVKNNGGTTMWINRADSRPPAGISWDFAVRGDCQYLATMLGTGFPGRRRALDSEAGSVGASDASSRG